MQTAYNALNDIDAQLVVDRLSDEGIEAHVFGRFLSSASGELPAQSMIRVQVADDDVVRALRIVGEWRDDMTRSANETEPEPAAFAEGVPTVATGATRSNAGKGFGLVLAGALIGALCTYAAIRLPQSEEPFDFDDDGVVDVRYVYAGEQLKQIEYDRNGDGKTDFRDHPSTRIHGDSTQWGDDDFDGRFEYWTEIRKGWAAVTHYDTDSDGFEESRMIFRHGVAEELIFMAPPDGRVIKRIYYKSGEMERSEADLNNDGRFETRWTFDDIGEPIKVESQD